MLRKWLCQADIKIIIEPVDPVLIKSGYATMDGTDMVPVSTFKDGKSVYYFPGTSLKGVLRSHLERIARTLHPGSVCIPYYDDPKKRDIIPVVAEQDSHGCGFRSRGGKGRDTSSDAYADSCAICRLFGSLKFGGRFSIGDAYPLPNHAAKLESRNGVGIDRFTGGTVPGVLFDLQVLVGGKFEANLRLINFEIWQLAALNLLLLDMADEMITIGSGRSRGLGRVRVLVDSYCLTYVTGVNHLTGLYQLTTPQEQQDYCLHNWKLPNPIALPTAEVRGLRQCYDLSADWRTQLEPLIPAFADFLNWHGGPQGEVPESEAVAEQEVDA
jgi:CRISPR-associated RAMP protein (TIGR02581 family)